MIESISALQGGLAGTSSATSATRSASGAAVGGADFSSVLAEVSTNAIGTLKTGEAAAIGGIEGKASVQQVVEAIMSAEQTLQTAIAIRDKVVSAYQEISRMAV